MSGEEPHYGERNNKEQQRMYDDAKNDCDSCYQQGDKNVGKHGYLLVSRPYVGYYYDPLARRNRNQVV